MPMSFQSNILFISKQMLIHFSPWILMMFGITQIPIIFRSKPIVINFCP